MEVNIKQALKMFFSKSSFEMIYFEAFANALDANATEFNINISLSNYGELHNLIVILSDNGVGFNDVRFGKFSKLFDVEEQSHKGLGRLVYLCYFDKVEVKSVFDNSKQRVFEFNEAFDKDCTITEIEPTLNGSIFRMSGFTGERLIIRKTKRYGTEKRSVKIKEKRNVPIEHTFSAFKHPFARCLNADFIFCKHHPACNVCPEAFCCEYSIMSVYLLV